MLQEHHWYLVAICFLFGLTAQAAVIRQSLYINKGVFETVNSTFFPYIAFNGSRSFTAVNAMTGDNTMWIDPLTINENEKLAAMITIYPNPAMNELFITSENKDIQDVELELINSLGQQVCKNKMKIDMSPAVLKTEDLPNGIYQVRIRCRNFLIYKKIVITK